MKHFLTYTLLLFCTISYAQCDKEILERRIKTRYGYKSRGEYCEGFYRILTSGNIKSEIFHFTKGKLEYSKNERDTLLLGTVNNYDFPIKIRAANISGRSYYQMDGIIMTGKVLEWDTGKVLIKNTSTRRYENIGIFAYRAESLDNPTYIPVKVGNGNNNYEIRIRASKKLNNVRWRIRGFTEFKNLEKTIFLKNYPIEIVLTSDIPSGKYMLDVQANNGDFFKSYNIFL